MHMRIRKNIFSRLISRQKIRQQSASSHRTSPVAAAVVATAALHAKIAQVPLLIPVGHQYLSKIISRPVQYYSPPSNSSQHCRVFSTSSSSASTTTDSVLPPVVTVSATLSQLTTDGMPVSEWLKHNTSALNAMSEHDQLEFWTGIVEQLCTSRYIATCYDLVMAMVAMNLPFDIGAKLWEQVFRVYVAHLYSTTGHQRAGRARGGHRRGSAAANSLSDSLSDSTGKRLIRVYEEFVKRDGVPDAQLLSQLVRILGRVRELELVQLFYREIKTHQIAPDRPTEADMLVRGFLFPNPETRRVPIRRLLDVYAVCVEKQLAVTTVVRIMQTVGRVRLQEYVFDCLEDSLRLDVSRGSTADEKLLWNTAVQQAANCNAGAGFELYERMKKECSSPIPTSETCIQLLGSLRFSPYWRNQLPSMYEELKQACGAVVPRHFLRLALQVACQMPNTAAGADIAKTILNDIINSNGSLPIRVLGNFFVALGRAGEKDAMVEYKQRLLALTTHTIHRHVIAEAMLAGAEALQSNFTDNVGYRLSNEILQEANSNQVIISDNCNASAMRTADLAGEWQHVEQLYREQKDRRSRHADHYLVSQSTMVELLAKHDRVQDAWKLANEMDLASAPQSALTALARACAKHNDVELFREVCNIWYDASTVGGRDELAAYEMYLSTVQNDADTLLALFHYFDQVFQGFIPLQMYHCAFFVLGKNGDGARLLSLCKHLHRNPVAEPNDLTRQLIQTSGSEISNAALELINAPHDEETAPPPMTEEEILQFKEKLNQLDLIPFVPELAK
jgi:hypothetical protein